MLQEQVEELAIERTLLLDVDNKTEVFPGIDIGIPTGRDSRKASADDTYPAVAAASRLGHRA